MSPVVRITDPSMRMRLLLTAGLAALVSTSGAAGALGPMPLRE